MTPDKLKALFAFYLAELAKQEYPPRQMDGLEYVAPFPGRRALLRHAAWTCQRSLLCLDTPYPEGTPSADPSEHRESLGWIQATLLGAGLYSMDDLRNHQLGWERLTSVK